MVFRQRVWRREGKNTRGGEQEEVFFSALHTLTHIWRKIVKRRYATKT